MEIVPHLRDLRAAVVQRSLARRSLVVSCAGTANVRRSTVFGAQSFLEVREGVGSAVGRNDVVVGEPLEGVQAAVVEDDGLEEVDHLFVLGVLGTVAGNIEGGEAGGMLAELVLWLCQLWLAFCLVAIESIFDLHPRGPGSGSSAQSSTCSCTRAGRTDRMVPGRYQCRNRCKLEQLYRLADRSWC